MRQFNLGYEIWGFLSTLVTIVTLQLPEKYIGDGATACFVGFSKDDVLLRGALLTELHLYRGSKTWVSSGHWKC